LESRFDTGLLDNLEILQTGLCSHAFPLHYHDSFCLSLINKGMMAENNVIAPAGSLLISHPFEVHQNDLVHETNYALTTFYVSSDLFASLALEKNFCFEEKVLLDNELYTSFVRLSALAAKGKIIDRKRFESCFIASAQQLINKYATPQPFTAINNPHLLDSVKQYIIEHIDQKISLDTLAKMTGKDKYQFIRWFRKLTGLTPMHFMILNRVEKAKKMMKAGKPIVHAALDAGFYDQSHFTNYFKHFTGITPKEYQQHCNIFQDFGA
jgi:AraC-like DNA-binding protein